jgi:hypothetical protein
MLSFKYSSHGHRYHQVFQGLLSKILTAHTEAMSFFKSSKFVDSLNCLIFSWFPDMARRILAFQSSAVILCFSMEKNFRGI